MTRLRAALAALALVAAVLVGGCAQTPDTTAVINGVVIRENTVDDLTSQLVPIATADRATVRSSIVSALVLGEVARQVAAQQRIDLGTPDTTALSANPGNAALLATPAGQRYFADAYAWASLYAQVATKDAQGNVDTTALQGDLRAESVVLNPRYGAWDVAAAASNTGAVSANTGSMSDLTHS